jgi:3-oxoacyl-[acyl-carrier protein] reductase
MSDAALVTGAANGLGTVIARALHAAGYRVAFADIDAEGAVRAARDADASGTTAAGFALDVRDAAAFERVRADLVERWGSLEVLVNNAALQRATPLFDISTAEFDEVLGTNAGGTFAGSQVVGRYFQARRYGRIVNVASLAGQNGGTATGAHYAASKGAILTLTKVFARELAPFGVTVNAIAPGPLDLDSVRRLVPPERLATLVDAIPVKTLGDPAFIAGLVVRLAARDAGFVTGATWDVNGGLFMR